MLNKRSTDSRWLSLLCKRVQVPGILLETVYKRTNWNCLGRQLGYKLCSCLAGVPLLEWFFHLQWGTCPLPPSPGVCPRLVGHGVCREASCTFLALTCLSIGCRDNLPLVFLWWWCLFILQEIFSPPQNLLFQHNTEDYAVSDRSDVIWKTCLGKSWRAAAWIVIQLRPTDVGQDSWEFLISEIPSSHLKV